MPLSGFVLPVALLALAAVPMIAGSLRLVDLSTGSEVLPSNPRFSASPLPVVIHIVSATGFALLGALQFYPQGCATWGVRR